MAYIDDVAVYSETWEPDLDHLEKVLRTLSEAGSVNSPANCRFVQLRVKVPRPCCGIRHTFPSSGNGKCDTELCGT